MDSSNGFIYSDFISGQILPNWKPDFDLFKRPGFARFWEKKFEITMLLIRVPNLAPSQIWKNNPKKKKPGWQDYLRFWMK